ncbi:MAG: ABC transporter ATP-binding protein/permease [Crocinitomicaceae bacterium]|nr:ABC transporter ATP-binding protein/permease [Crocinitomicaceae bacterium]
MKSLGYLNKYFFKYKWRLLLGIAFIICVNYVKVKMPEYFGTNFDELNEGNGERATSVMTFALYMGAGYLLLSLISGTFLFLQRQTIIIMSRLIEYDLKNEVYDQYQKLSNTFYKKNSTGDLMNRISEDVTKVRMYLGPGLMYTINLLFLSMLSIYKMVSINGYLTVIVLLPLPLMSFLIYKVSSRMNRLSGVVQTEQSHMSTLAQEYFSGIRVVKAYSRDKTVQDKFDDSSESYKEKNMRLVLVNSLFIPIIFALIGLSTLLVLYIGGLLHYSNQISQGDIIQFIFYVNMLTWPFASIGWVTSLIQRAAASQTRINEFLNEKSEIHVNCDTPFNFQGAIEFKNVSYTYKNSGIRAIQNLSFKLERNETLGIVGNTGSGKSTILGLLMRQIDPDEGEILIDGKPLKEINLKELRNQTGIVPQDVFLFSDSVGNNISFGALTDDVTEDDLIEVTKQAHVYHNIQEFKDGFDTILGERGVNLSGGQKQRVSIARALIRNPKLLLLDDSLSAVDTETEEIILKNLKERKVNASIVVSHRISSIRHANRIINISDGQKTEEGSHADLMAMNGSYAEMYQKQLVED